MTEKIITIHQLDTKLGIEALKPELVKWVVGTNRAHGGACQDTLRGGSMSKLMFVALLAISANAYSCDFGDTKCSSAENDRFFEDQRRAEDRRNAEQYAAEARFARQLQDSRDADNQRRQAEYQHDQLEAEEKLLHALRYGY